MPAIPIQPAYKGLIPVISIKGVDSYIATSDFRNARNEIDSLKRVRRSDFPK